VIKIYPLVSICCITYNHEKYIADALESFLMQKTEFPIEVIIHDDASTDNTVNIIREYEKKYPNIIKPIYQNENQFSKGINISEGIVWPKAKGKYIALCEGDDFWNDSQKLQKQVMFLDNNPDYSMCFHAVEVVDTKGIPTGRYLGPYKKGNNNYTIKENVIGGFVHVSSVLMRAGLVKKGMPEWCLKARHGDYALSLYLSANGKTYFIDQVMSSHRIGVENSLMTKLKQNYSIDNEIKYHKQRLSTLEEADKYYNYKFKEELEHVKLISQVKILMLENKYRELIRNQYRKFFKQNGLSGTVKFVLLTKFPKLALSLSRLKGKWVLFKLQK